MNLSAGDAVPDDEMVTQLGQVAVQGDGIFYRYRFDFRCAVREARAEQGMSVLLGRVDVTTAVRLIATGDKAGPADAVRTVAAGELKKSGFDVTFTPSKRVRKHVTVEWIEGPWDDDATERFAQCFNEYVLGG